MLSLILKILVAGIIIILLLDFFAWIFFEKAGGVVIVIIGIIFFLSSYRIVGIALGVIGIWVFVKANDSSEKIKKTASKKYNLKIMYELVDECWNSENYEFNWKHWFDKKDETFYDESAQEVKKSAQLELQSKGKLQIGVLNTYIEKMMDEKRRDWAMKEIKARQSIILDLTCIFKEPYSCDLDSNSRLINEVSKYRQDIYDYIIYEKKQLNQEKLLEMIKRGIAIQFEIS